MQGEDRCTITKSRRKTTPPQAPKQHITSTIAPFLFSSHYAVCCICLSLPSCNVTERFSHVTALQEGKHVSLLETSTSTTERNSDPVSFSLVAPIHQEGIIIGEDVLAYTGVRSKQGLKYPVSRSAAHPRPVLAAVRSQHTARAPAPEDALSGRRDDALNLV